MSGSVRERARAYERRYAGREGELGATTAGAGAAAAAVDGNRARKGGASNSEAKGGLRGNIMRSSCRWLRV